MAYATIADVEARNSARRFTPQTKPSTDDVTRFLVDTAGEIEAALRGRAYVVPIPTTATSAIEFLRAANSLGGYAWAERSAEASPHRDAAWKLWMDTLKGLKDGSTELDSPRDLQSTRPRGQFAPSAWFSRDMVL
jgi:hypothetical protein